MIKLRFRQVLDTCTLTFDEIVYAIPDAVHILPPPGGHVAAIQAFASSVICKVASRRLEQMPAVGSFDPQTWSFLVVRVERREQAERVLVSYCRFKTQMRQSAESQGDE